MGHHTEALLMTRTLAISAILYSSSYWSSFYIPSTGIVKLSPQEIYLQKQQQKHPLHCYGVQRALLI